ncbi:MAG: elongation factor P [Patescibacteria group bacterium]|nr:elongation factor P [Patescibacteria group bacterium]
MLTITDLKVGRFFEFNGEPYVVTHSEHSKLGRGGAIMRTKIRNLLTGAIIDRTFKGSDAFSEPDLEFKKAQFLYKDSGDCYFMDPISFEQFSVKEEKIGLSANYLKEGTGVRVVFYQGHPINIELPIKLALKITYTEPGFKGNTTSTALKPATLETGAKIQVPLFVKIDDSIIIDTRTGQYIERA